MKKRNAYLELFSLLGILYLAGFLIHQHDPFWGQMSPSPYWVIIVLIALRYGSPPGLVTGIVCSVMYMLSISDFSLAQLRANIFLNPSVLLTPGVYVGVGLFIGENVHSAIKRGDFLAGKLAKSRDRVEGLEKERNDLEKSYRQIEGKIAGESNTLYHLLSALDSYNECEESELPSITCSLCERFLHSRNCNYWVRRGTNQWERIYPVSAEKPQIPTLAKFAISEDRIISSRDYIQYAQDSDCDLAGVIKFKRKSTDRSEIHLITVDKIKFSQWHSRIESLFSFILREAGVVLSRIELQKALDHKMPIEKELRLEGISFVRSHVQKALLAQERSGGVSSVIFIHIVSPEHQNDLRIMSIVASALRCLLRVSDAAVFLPEITTFAAFLPDTNQDGAKIAFNKIMQRLRDLKLYEDDRQIECKAEFYELTERGQFDDLLKEMHQTVTAEIV